MNNVYSKVFIETLIAKTNFLKEDLATLNSNSLTMNNNTIKEILNECDYLIAGLFGLINPNKKEFQFDKKKSDVEFINYAEKYISALEEDLNDIKFSKIFAD